MRFVYENGWAESEMDPFEDGDGSGYGVGGHGYGYDSGFEDGSGYGAWRQQ